jgi:hypothetical protein
MIKTKNTNEQRAATDTLEEVTFLGCVDVNGAALTDTKNDGEEGESHGERAKAHPRRESETTNPGYKPGGGHPRDPANGAALADITAAKRHKTLHRKVGRLPRPRRTTTLDIDGRALGAINLITALPDLQEHGRKIQITQTVMRGRRARATHEEHKNNTTSHRAENDQRHQREGAAGNLLDEVSGGESKHAFSARCNMAHVAETQTDAEAFRKAAQKMRGEFPDEALIRRCHDCTHPSFPVTWRRVVRATGIGPGAEQANLKKQVRHFCDACLICQKLQPARERVAARVGSIKKRPFGEYAFDIIVLNAPDVDDNRYVLTVIDSFSKAVELFPLKKASAEAVTTCLHDVLCRWGRPYQVRCDNAKAFAASVTKQLLKRAKVKQHFTAPYSHNSNGQVENANRRVMEILRAMILDDRLGPQTALQWSLLLPAVRRVLMSRMILQYGCCPNDIAYMFCPENEDSIFADEFWNPDAQEPAQDQENIAISTLRRQHQTLIDACEEAQDLHLAKLATLQEMQAPDLDPILPGEFVLVNMKERPHSKINSPWSGPWQVIETEDNDPAHPIITLQHIANKKIDRFNASMCKRCNLDLYNTLEEAIPIAAADNFEYEIEAILDHRPRGERKRKRKDTYEFQVLWRGIERSEDNPSWEPWANESLRASEPMQRYCERSDVQAELGKDFLPKDKPDEAPRQQRQRPE